MAYINLASSQSVHNRYIGANGFKGVDFSSAPAFVALDRFSDAKNVYKDYKNGLGACVETFPGYRVVYDAKKDTGMDYEVNRILQFKFSSGNSYLFANLSDTAWAFQKIPEDGGENEFIATVDGTHVTSAFVYSDALYIFTGEGCCKFTKNDIDDLINNSIIADYPLRGYIPTTFRDGDPYEQKNMLTREFVETFTVSKIEGNGAFTAYTYDWREISEKVPGRYWYTLTEGGEKIYINSTNGENGYVKRDGKTTIFHIPSEKKPYSLGLDFSAGSGKVTTYSRTVVEGEGVSENSGISVTFFPREKVEVYSSVLFDNAEIAAPLSVSYEKDLDGNIESITISQESTSGDVLDNPLIREGSILVVSGKSVSDAVYEGRPIFGAAYPEYKGSYSGAVCGCTMIAYFDGRIFLAGNPSLPNVVFYSSRMLNGANSITYFGNLNYVSVGESTYPIKALVSAADKLVVLKDGDSAEPSMFYLTGIDTGENLIPRIYAITSGIPSVGCVGAACNFLDDIVFTSKIGIVGINKQAINLERSVGNRSSLINGRLLLEDMTQAVMAEWQGYLCVLFKNNGHLYLADSRQTSSGEYEWYYIDSLGSWKGDYQKYTYLDENGDEVVLTKEQADLVKYHGGIYYIDSDESDSYGSGEIVVEPDGSMIGGEFYPATSIFSNGDLLFFGTGEGKIMIVNTDKRGVPSETENPPKTDTEGKTEGETVPSEPFDAEAYKAECGNLIRPEWYSFADHEYESFVQTAYDDGGIPHLAKSTVSRSTVGDMKPMPGSRFFFKVYTADANWQDLGASGNVIPDFSLWSFDTISFQQDVHTISTVNERTRKWSRKMYRIYSGGFCQPFGIYKISYRYVVAGRIRQ